MAQKKTDKPNKSENRQRQLRTTIRLTDEEYALAAERAAHSGLSLSGYFRLKALDDAGLRHQKRARPNRVALGQITAALQRLSAEHNKIGSNINQLAKKANSQGFDKLAPNEITALLEAYETAVTELSAMRASVLQKMGFHDR